MNPGIGPPSARLARRAGRWPAVALEMGSVGHELVPRAVSQVPTGMQVHFGLPPEALGPSHLTLGSFDGVHVGHQAVIERTVECARAGSAAPVLITFEPHPRCVLDPINCPKSITTLEEKLALVEPLGVQHAAVMRFDAELAQLGAEAFVGRLAAGFDLRGFVLGYDFFFGHGREGNAAWLARHGHQVVVVDPVQMEGVEVHSSEIRRLVTLGEVARASVLLGRPFSLAGPVEPGDQVGRELGYPTANIAIEANKLVPGHGVYAGWVRTPGGEHPGAFSVGYRPTFAGTKLRVEAYLLDFEGDLYRQRLELRFIARLRDEIRYDDTASLVAQMARDVEDTRRILGDSSSPRDAGGG